MNQLHGIIRTLESSKSMTIVEVEVGSDTFSAVVLEVPDDNALLKAGQPVTLLFKETEVAIGKGLSGMISLRNRISSKITAVRLEPILAHIVLDYRGEDIFSIISSRSAEQMALAQGDEVEWLVKTNEITLLFDA